MKQYQLFLIMILSCITTQAFSAVIENFQMPAWIEINGQKKAIRINMKVNEKQPITTGESGKAYITMEEGSILKIGPKSKVNIIKLTPVKTEKSVFKSVVSIVRGAFRFTTSDKAKKRQRDIRFKVRTITAGIRGTDIWGKSTPERDFVCLLEGNITVQHENETEQTMAKPLTFFVANRGQPAKKIATVPLNELKKWAKSTDTQVGEGRINKKGRYTLNLKSFNRRFYAQRWQNKLDKAGYAADIREIPIAGKIWYRLSINFIASYRDAAFLSKKLKKQGSFNSAWIGKNQ